MLCQVWRRPGGPADVASLRHVAALLWLQPAVRVGRRQVLQSNHLLGGVVVSPSFTATFMRKTTRTTWRLILVFLLVCSSFHSLATMYVLHTEMGCSPPTLPVRVGRSQSRRNTSTEIYRGNFHLLNCFHL